MSRTIIYPYKIGSASAKLISGALDALRVRPDGRYSPRRGDFIINWGNSTLPRWYEALRPLYGLLHPFGAHLLNKPEAVGNASNKLKTFRILQEAEVAIPEFATDGVIAREWVDNGEKVYARLKLTGHSGEGIIVCEEEDMGIPQAPLYTKGIENHGEYRVHVVGGKVIDYTKKRLKLDTIQRDDAELAEMQRDVRNLASGWVYTRENLRHLERIEQLAISAVSALGLDFGAVDIIKDENRDVFVLEVNTACGMSESTLSSYVSAFRDVIENHA